MAHQFVPFFVKSASHIECLWKYWVYGNSAPIWKCLVWLSDVAVEHDCMNVVCKCSKSNKSAEFIYSLHFLCVCVSLSLYLYKYKSLPPLSLEWLISRQKNSGIEWKDRAVDGCVFISSKLSARLPLVLCYLLEFGIFLR